MPGDVVLLSAGNLVPADGLVVEAKDFFVAQAVLTGETFPVEKEPGTVTADASLAGRTNCVFMGTSVRSGTARVVIARTGLATVFGEIADRLALLPPEGEFERGIRHFGYLLTQVMAVIVIVVFAANLYLERPLVESLLFAVALAVGLSPELLPAIMSVTLSAGARKMAESGVIVRHLSAIENLGSMDVLCTDKTGTLTEGVVRLDGALDPAGNPAPLLLRDAALNARLQTGLANPLDEAIAAAAQAQNALGAEFRKLDEIPYDFVRKRLSVVVAENGSAPAGPRLISKGALANILEICNRVADGETAAPLDAARREGIAGLFAQWSSQGYRVLGVAAGPVAVKPRYTKADETRPRLRRVPAVPRSAQGRHPRVPGRLRGRRRPRQDRHGRQHAGGRASGGGRRHARGPTSDREAAERPAGRGVVAPRGTHRSVRRGRPEPEGAHHPGPEAHRARCRLSRRRHQRRAGAACGRCRHLRRQRGRRGQAGGRFRAAASAISMSCGRASRPAAPPSPTR